MRQEDSKGGKRMSEDKSVREAALDFANWTENMNAMLRTLRINYIDKKMIEDYIRACEEKRSKLRAAIEREDEKQSEVEELARAICDMTGRKPFHKIKSVVRKLRKVLDAEPVSNPDELKYKIYHASCLTSNLTCDECAPPLTPEQAEEVRRIVREELRHPRYDER